jgi:hypothetical protein
VDDYQKKEIVYLFMIEIKLTTEQAEGLQKHVANHMELCLETIDSEDCVYITEGGEIFETYGPYCGCETCNTREQLMATFAYLRDEKIVDIFVDDES